MSNLLKIKYWLDFTPEPLLPIFQKIFVGSIVLFAVATLIFWFLKKRKRNLYTSFLVKLYTWSLTNFCFGLILHFFNYELVPFLSARFWFAIWGVSIIIWLFYILKDITKIPEIKVAREKESEFKKYIP